MTSCLDGDTAERFVAGTASRRECREIVLHLLAGCGACAGLLRSIFRPPVEEGDYDGALARMIDRARAFEPVEVGRP